MSFSGDLHISDDVKVGAFRAGGLFVKVRLLTTFPLPPITHFALFGSGSLIISQDCLVFSIHAPDQGKYPWSDVRMVVPVRLTTDSWDTEGGAAEYSIPSSPSEEGVGQQRFEGYQDHEEGVAR